MKYSNPLRQIADRVREAAGPDVPHRVHNRAVVVHFERLHSAVSELENLQKSRNPLETSAVHAQRVARAAQKVEARTLAIEKSLYEQMNSSIGLLSDEIDRKANLVENSYAAEIRASVRGMSHEDRNKVLQFAVDSGDSATIAALTSGPAVITGLSPEAASRMRDHHRRQQAPELFQAMDDLNDGFSAVSVAVKSSLAAVNEAMDPKRLEEIDRQQTAAMDAQSRFDAAMS